MRWDWSLSGPDQNPVPRYSPTASAGWPQPSPGLCLPAFHRLFHGLSCPFFRCIPAPRIQERTRGLGLPRAAGAEHSTRRNRAVCELLRLEKDRPQADGSRAGASSHIQTGSERLLRSGSAIYPEPWKSAEMSSRPNNHSLAALPQVSFSDRVLLPPHKTCVPSWSSPTHGTASNRQDEPQ